MSLTDLLSTFKKPGQALIPRIDQYLIRKINAPNDRAQNCIHPSGIHNCVRRTVYELIGAEGEGGNGISPQVQRIFDNGTGVHERLQSYLVAMGILDTKKNKDGSRSPAIEVYLRHDPTNITGSADGVLLIDNERIVLEIKSMNSYGFNALKAPKPEHIIQAHCYMLALGIKKALFLYESKDTQQLKEFLIPWDQKTIDWIEKRCKDINDSVVDTQLPPREHCDGPDAQAAKYCPYAKICFTNKKFEDVADPKAVALTLANINRTPKRKSPLKTNVIQRSTTKKFKLRLLK